VKSVLATLENACGSLAMLAMVVLPLGEIVFRRALATESPGQVPSFSTSPSGLGSCLK